MTPYISFYQNVRRPDSQQTISISDWIAGTVTGRWKAPVERARAEYQQNGKSDKYKKLKDVLPAVTPSGTFEHRKNDKLIMSSGVVHGDIDELSYGRLLHVFDLMIDDPLVYYAFPSPSNAGIKFGYRIPIVTSDEEYKSRFYAFQKHAENTYSVELDPACKDVSRACYVSYDTHTYFNPDAETFHEIADPPADTPKPMQAAPVVYYSRCEHPGLDHAIREIEAAPLGTRNRTRIRMGRLVGGLIAGGQLDSSAASTLADVAANHSDHPEQARKDIAKGIAYGQQSAIYPEAKPFTGFTGFKSRYARRGVRHV